MKIVHLINSLRKGGAERICINTCNTLAQDKNNEVYIFTLEGTNDYAHIIDERVKVINGDITINLSLTKKNNIENENYIEFIDNLNPDILHSHLPWSDMLMLSYPIKGVKFFSHIHNSYIQEQVKFQWKSMSKKTIIHSYERNWLMKRYISTNTHFIACSFDAEAFFHKNIKTKGLNVSLFINATELPKSQEPKVLDRKPLNLISIGALTVVKNHTFLIDVIEVLKTKYPSIKLTILGEGVERQNLEAKINRLNLQNNIRLEGNVNDVHAYLDNNDLMVHSAKYEGLPISFIEAISKGVPIVSSQCINDKDIISHDHDGYINDGDKLESFVDYVIDLIENRDKFITFSKNAINSSKKFDINNYTEKLLRLYNS